MRVNITPNQVKSLLESLGRVTAGKMITESELSEDEVKSLVGLFRPFAPSEDVTAGEFRAYNSELYVCVQDHTTQSDWTPDITPALWTIKSAPGIIPVWVQPTGAHDAYAIGDRVQWPDGGTIWESTIDANTTEPGTLLEHGYWIEVTV